MSTFTRSATLPLVKKLNSIRRLGTTTTTTAAGSRPEGDISSVFVSLSGVTPEPLPKHFAHLKRELIRGNEERISTSWKRLLAALAEELDLVRARGSDIIPQIQFSDLKRNWSQDFAREVRKRGVAVIKGVVPEDEARAYKNEVEDYVRLNPRTKGFPQHDPQVYELYWSSPQVRARGHPNMLETQKLLMDMWTCKDPDALISTSQPLTYADRVRIRQPGDASFALGPHVDGGSVERWEMNGYGLGGVYDKIWQGSWEEYDPFESSSRIPAVSDLYHGAGACSMFRMFQGWLGLSHTAPGEGTLMVNPMLQMATAYFLLRPFFQPRVLSSSLDAAELLDGSNWRLISAIDMDSSLPGANLGVAQELNDGLHPHLHLSSSMIHVPKISPADYVAWHCDTIHAVDKVHVGNADSSAMYIPVCPMTENNARHLARQRATFFSGHPAPDFPGGVGESNHVGRPTMDFLVEATKDDGLRAMGLSRLQKKGMEETSGAAEVIRRANTILGFS